MRVILGLLGAVIGILAGFYFLGPMAGHYYTSVNEFNSPDQAGNAHETIFVGTILAAMLAGYVLGWVIGRFITENDAMEDI